MSHIQSFSESDRNGGGEDIQQHGTDMPLQASESIKAAIQASLPEPQGSQRARKLTEKGQELHKEQAKRVQHRFIKSYDKWKAVIKDAKGVLSEECPNSLLHEHITKVSDTANDLNNVYEELRRIDIPDPDTRRRIDTCEAVTKTIIKTIIYTQNLMKIKELINKTAKRETENLCLSLQHQIEQASLTIPNPSPIGLQFILEVTRRSHPEAQASILLTDGRLLLKSRPMKLPYRYC